jgi:hypothetical protein
MTDILFQTSYPPAGMVKQGLKLAHGAQVAVVDFPDQQPLLPFFAEPRPPG